MIRQRYLSVGDIEYIYIPKERSVLSALFTPNEFNNGELSTFFSFPKNVLQLNDPYTYYGNVKKLQSFTPHRFGVYYPDSIDALIEQNPYKFSVKVFLLHSETKGLDEIIAKITKVFRPVFLLCVDKVGSKFRNYEDISILDPKDFITKLQAKRVEIEDVLLASFPKIPTKFEVDLPRTDLHLQTNPFYYFSPTHTNYYTLNQILGNIWNEPDITTSSDAPIEEAAKNLRADKNSLERFKFLVDQINRMSNLEIMTLKDRGVIFPNGNSEGLSPLIWILPFNYPTLGELYGDDLDAGELKKLKRALSHEQAINYISYTSTDKITAEEIPYHGTLQRRRAMYLDGLGYLHSSFTFSPVLRFPMLGDSIKRELSFFKPQNLAKNWKNSKDLIDKFGLKLASLILPPQFADDILELPRQIVALTDLPVEWLPYRWHSLCFTHDVTRIPEMPYGGIMAAYRNSCFVQFDIQNDIVARTLVLLGANEIGDDEFGEYFSSIEEESKRLGYKTFRCKSIDDVKIQIENIKPAFLIFDCHGGYDEDTMSSYLIINGEKLTSSDIVKHKITAPLVFLSACHTNPNYGYLNKIADAFFEAGCLAITATYFPISISNGTNLYYRVLRNLGNAVKY